MSKQAAVTLRAPGPEAETRDAARPDGKINALISAGLDELRNATADLDARGIIEIALHGAFAGETAVLSSFGAESAVLLHLISLIDARTPVLFVDTRRMFPETLAYRDILREFFGLTDVRTVVPASDCSIQPVAGKSAQTHSMDACCFSRRVLPLRNALGGFSAIITGRKRFQTATRATMDVVEFFDGRFRFNPLASWTVSNLDAYMSDFRLPCHPLVQRGYPSIGCREPCTCAVGHGSYSRTGRWPGRNKEECGIHTARGAA